jgi:hypothetical protein
MIGKFMIVHIVIQLKVPSSCEFKQLKYEHLANFKDKHFPELGWMIHEAGCGRYVFIYSIASNILTSSQLLITR